MDLHHIPYGTRDAVTIYIEIPRGSKNKYEYDELLGMIKLDFSLSGQLSFPADYGSIPQTFADDGDMLDAFVLSDHAFVPGIVVSARPLGMLELSDNGEADNKLITVALKSTEQFLKSYQSIEDLSADERESFQSFFAELGRQKGKTMDILGFRDRDHAQEEIERCHARWKARVNSS